MKTLMISDEAYEKLSAIKGKKSFTELLSELAEYSKSSQLGDIEEFFGVMGKNEAAELERITKNIRKRARARI